MQDSWDSLPAGIIRGTLHCIAAGSPAPEELHDLPAIPRPVDYRDPRRRHHAGARRTARGAVTAAVQEAERPYLLERIDDAAIGQIYADGFEGLDLREKVLIWHLYNAALAGRDIFYDQRYVHNLDMRETFEEILTHVDGVEAETLEAVHATPSSSGFNTGPYNNLTARKFVLETTPEAFRAAAHAAASAGARFPTRDGESLDALLDRLEPLFFDAAVDPILTNKTPAPGDDMLLSSANNLYDGVSTADLEGFDEQYPLNSRLVKRGGELVEEVYRIDGGGKYAKELTEVVRHLDAAIPFATAPMAAAIEALITWYRTGEPLDRRTYDIAWVADRDVARRHHQRLHRGLHGRAGRQGRLGGAGLLRQPREDRDHSDPGRARPVVRGPHALGSALSQGRRAAASPPTPSTW